MPFVSFLFILLDKTLDAFHVIQEMVFLSDDCNTAAFPQENGVCERDAMAGRHYQVNGESSMTTQHSHQQRHLHQQQASKDVFCLL